MGRIALQAVAALLLVTACYDNHSPYERGEQLEAPTATIAELRSRCSERVATIESRMVVEGRVVSSDKEGNFYRSFFIEDATAGAEILSGLYDNHSLYPLGVRISMSLEGCAVVLRDNIVQIGLPTDPSALRPASFDVPSLLASFVRRESSALPLVATEVECRELSVAMCGTLVAVSGLRYEPLEEEEVTMCGYRRFVTNDGHQLYCSTSYYADFANYAVPCGEVTLRGILHYESVGAGDGRHFVIKPSLWSDVSPLDSPSATTACGMQ